MKTLKHLQLYEQYNQSKIDEILDRVSQNGIKTLTTKEMQILKTNSDNPVNEVDISFKEFKNSFIPIYYSNPNLPFNEEDAKLYFWDYYVFDDYTTNSYLANATPYCIWTIINGEGKDLYITNGFYRIDTLGYVVTKNSWVCGNDYWIKI